MGLLDIATVPAFRRLTLVAALVAFAGLPAAPALAQQAAAIPATNAKERPGEAELLTLFTHYVMVDRRDLAASYAQELLDRNLSNLDFVKLVESGKGGDPSKIDQAITRALRIQELQDQASKLYKAFETGKLERARDANEIAANIQALTGPIAGKLLAQAALGGDVHPLAPFRMGRLFR